MSAVKDRIPNEESLQSLIEAAGEAVFLRVKESVRSFENVWKRNRRLFVCSLMLLFFSFSLFQIWPTSPDSYSKHVVFAVLVSFSCLSLWLLNRMTDSRMIFDQEVNRVVFKEVFAVMGISGELTSSSVLSTRLQLNESELITRARNAVSFGDAFVVKMDRGPVFVHELNVNNVVDFGKYQYTKHIFNGYFVCMKLSRSLTGKTFVSTEGDESGFGHTSFWTRLVGGEVNETVMEWNEFESLLHVATTDESEARYILTPDFMQNLYDWWLGQKTNIRLAFIADHMYLLFPDKKVRVDGTISGLSKRKVKKYMFTIARPLLHVVHLAEGVRG